MGSAGSQDLRDKQPCQGTSKVGRRVHGHRARLGHASGTPSSQSLSPLLQGELLDLAASGTFFPKFMGKLEGAEGS